MSVRNYCRTDNALADLRGGAPGTRPLLSQILSFSCSFRENFDQIIGWHPHLEVSTPCLGNPGSATALNDFRFGYCEHYHSISMSYLTNKILCQKKMFFTTSVEKVMNSFSDSVLILWLIHIARDQDRCNRIF